MDCRDLLNSRTEQLHNNNDLGKDMQNTVINCGDIGFTKSQRIVTDILFLFKNHINFADFIDMQSMIYIFLLLK